MISIKFSPIEQNIDSYLTQKYRNFRKRVTTLFIWISHTKLLHVFFFNAPISQYNELTLNLSNTDHVLSISEIETNTSTQWTQSAVQLHIVALFTIRIVCENCVCSVRMCPFMWCLWVDQRYIFFVWIIFWRSWVFLSVLVSNDRWS